MPLCHIRTTLAPGSAYRARTGQLTPSTIAVTAAAWTTSTEKPAAAVAPGIPTAEADPTNRGPATVAAVHNLVPSARNPSTLFLVGSFGQFSSIQSHAAAPAPHMVMSMLEVQVMLENVFSSRQALNGLAFAARVQWK